MFIRRLTHYRVASMAIVMFLSTTISKTLLVLPACLLLFAAISYGKILYLGLEHDLFSKLDCAFL
jgi:hypothetical protein